MRLLRRVCFCVALLFGLWGALWLQLFPESGVPRIWYLTDLYFYQRSQPYVQMLAEFYHDHHAPSWELAEDTRPVRVARYASLFSEWQADAKPPSLTWELERCRAASLTWKQEHTSPWDENDPMLAPAMRALLSCPADFLGRDAWRKEVNAGFRELMHRYDTITRITFLHLVKKWGEFFGVVLILTGIAWIFLMASLISLIWLYRQIRRG